MKVYTVLFREWKKKEQIYESRNLGTYTTFTAAKTVVEGWSKVIGMTISWYGREGVDIGISSDLLKEYPGCVAVSVHNVIIESDFFKSLI